MTASNSIVKLALLRDWVAAEAVRSASIIGGRGGWAVSVRHGQAERILAGKNGEPRLYAKLDTAAKQLLDLGVLTFEVKGANYATAPTRSIRPDRAAVMKAANAYGAWLKSEVQGTVDALARGEMRLISEAEMENRWATKRAALEQRRREAGA